MSERTNPSHGTKVNDPHSEIQESSGPVASDSLAADSSRNNGGFSENRDSDSQEFTLPSSTYANTNTSGAARLDPASDAEARQAKEDWAEERKSGSDATSYPSAAGGQSRGLAVENTTVGRDGPGVSTASSAPSYVSSQYVDVSGPKGRNLQEGGFESYDGKNASFNADIGGKNDPGRLAENQFQRTNAENAAIAGLPTQKGVSSDNNFGPLGGDTSA